MTTELGRAKYRRRFEALFEKKPIARSCKKWIEHVVLPLWSVRVLERYKPRPHFLERGVEIDTAKLAGDLDAMGTPDQAAALVLKIVHELQGDLRRAKDLLSEEQARTEKWHGHYRDQ